MAYHSDDTICAIATAPGGSARGMVRISGPEALAVASQNFQPKNSQPLDKLRRAAVVEGCASIVLHGALQPIPCDLFVWPTNRSYTREPVVELHTFGSQPILETVVSALCRAGARLAEPGEFTLRAFLAGRIDLTQAEAVLGVIDAGGKEELHRALAQLAGGLAEPLMRLRDDLLQMLAELEAGLDFVDEDIEFISSDELVERFNDAISLLDEVGQQMASRHTATSVPQVALVGAPNAGKSSLFNALVERYGAKPSARTQQQPAALVSPVRGTTRDYITAHIAFDGLQFELVDTAGMYLSGVAVDKLPPRKSQFDATIEVQAENLAAQRRGGADVRLFCIDATRPRGEGGVGLSTMLGDAKGKCDLIVLTKSDLAGDGVTVRVPTAAAGRGIVTSSRTGAGLSELCAALRDTLRDGQSQPCGTGVRSTAERCRESIRLAREALMAAKDMSAPSAGAELVAEELRAALDELGKVVGAVYTDDLLDRIFSKFCIGK